MDIQGLFSLSMLFFQIFRGVVENYLQFEHSVSPFYWYGLTIATNRKSQKFWFAILAIDFFDSGFQLLVGPL